MEKNNINNSKGISLTTKIAIIVTAFLLVLISVYIGVAVYYNGHFFPNTEINRIDVSKLTADDAKALIKSKVEKYNINISDKNGITYTLTGDDIKCEYNDSQEIEKLLENQNSFGWPVGIFKKDNLDMDVSITYDTKALTSSLANLSLFSSDSIVEPENASLELKNNEYVIVDAVEGNKPILENIVETVSKAVDSMQTSITLTDDDYEHPQVTSDDEILTKCLSDIQKYTSVDFEYTIEGNEEKLDKATLNNFIIVNDDYSVSLDDNKIAAYVQQLASKYNTYGDVRKFKTSVGDTVEIGGGDYGWIIDKESESAQLKEDILNGKSVKREPEYTQRAYVEGTDDIGSTYVEIDYTNQHLYYYVKGKLSMDTGIISGNLSASNGSPDGVFKIITKKSPSVLVGETYRTEVEYFIPFAYDVGIHDASWQSDSSFGTDFYKTSGSHGCINVPPSFAAALYDVIEIGTPVIAYYRDPVKLTNEGASISNAYSYSAN